ncbi:LysR family transcriptional regulator [Mesorhizobium sp. AR02]|uniref:LysR family transcriptional regulator n=1 Tax=Mesorhizobium sp. AR02 TaxID=2865837 RepID=UPI00215FC2D6|nr:LysR family transcriptional regulator [Mesorhizobium sp. AR02]UVK51468.1 LysR family transcriptional regulator [Mesorhizobium sp. AR02]
MHDIDWNDLRYVLALTREGSFAAAGRRLGLDPTTVARRLRAIERALGVRLFERGAEGEMRPTQAGEVAASRAEAVEAEIGGLTLAVKGADSEISGTVRVTAVPILINRVLIPAVADLVARHPGLRLELVADPHDVSLTRREADIALRLARPGTESGSRIIARRIGTLAYAAYAASHVPAPSLPGQITDLPGQATDLPWLTYEDGMAYLPQARWIAGVSRKDGHAPLVVNDAEPLLHAILAGLGRSLLPCIVADQMTGLTRLPEDGHPFPARELWLLTHPDLRHLARIAAVTAWIEATIQRLEGRSD